MADAERARCSRCGREIPVDSGQIRWWQGTHEGDWVCPVCLTDEDEAVIDEQVQDLINMEVDDAIKRSPPRPPWPSDN